MPSVIEMNDAKTISVIADGWAEWQGKRYRCALGRNGLTGDKREGDGQTPVGRFRLRRLYYRSDRLAPPDTGLEAIPLKPEDGWSDDPSKPDYNTLVKLPYEGSHERMWREDGLYDIVVAIGHNDDPVVPGQGSAVFIHLARPDHSPTDACIAFALPDLLEILKGCDSGTCLEIAD